MNLNGVYDFIYEWIDIVLNGVRSFDNYKIDDIGVCTFTNNSNIVTGTNFITNGIVQVGGFIRINTNYWVEVLTIDSETQITITSNYRSATDSDNAYYSPVGIDIVIGSQNVSTPNKQYIVIHEPAISNKKVGDTQRQSNYIVLPDTPTRTDTYLYEAVISLEEVNSNGDFLGKLLNTIENDTIEELWKDNYISLISWDEGTNNNDLTGTIFEKRFIQDITVFYTEIDIYESPIIEEIDITENYNLGG